MCSCGSLSPEFLRPGFRGSACIPDTARSFAQTHVPARTESALARLRCHGIVSRRFSADRVALCAPSRPFWQQPLTTYQTTFCDKPLPHTFPSLATLRKILPSVTLAAHVHWSRAALTHPGIGTVRMWPPLANQIHHRPVPWRFWMSSNSRPTSSDLRKPQPNSMASIA